MAALGDRWRKARDRDDYRSGIIAAQVVNTSHRDPKASVCSPADFFPNLAVEKRPIVDRLIDAFGGA